MKPFKPVQSIRVRYIIGLSAIALLITASFVTMQRVVSAQRGFSSLINLAGHQAGLSNRIAYFASLMATTDDETEFDMARAQVGRTINKIRSAHQTMRLGDPEQGVPQIINDNLRAIFDDPMVGLDLALQRFLERAEDIYASDIKTLSTRSASYLFLTTYGPHVLEPMLDAVVDEFATIGRTAIVRIERFELIIWLTALLTLLLELCLIFRPMEGRIRQTISSLETSIAELKTTRRRLVAAQQLASVGDWQLLVKEGRLIWSEQIYMICGVTAESFVVSVDEALRLIHPEDQAMVRTNLRRAVRDRRNLHMEYRVVRPDGTERLVYQQVVPQVEKNGECTALTGTIQDITDRSELSVRLEKLSENIPGFIYQLRLDADGSSRFPYASSGIFDIYGVLSEQVQVDSAAAFSRIHVEDRAQVHKKLRAAGEELRIWHDRYRVLHPDKGTIWVEGHAVPEQLPGGGTLWHGYIWDITERKHSEDQIRRLALYDSLTGLANRHLLIDRLRHAMKAARRNGKYGAVLMLDLDNFKTLNDTQGHDVGDALLIEVGRRLQYCVRESDTIARLGGDEFVVLLEQLGDNETEGRSRSMTIAEKIRTALNRTYQLGDDGPVHHASASIGVALFQGDEPSEGELLKRADVAMFEAKERGRNKACQFRQARQAIIDSKTAMARDLQHALEHDEFELHLQPQVTATGVIGGAEALLRWLPPGRKPVSPADFIPLAEETGLILPIGEWVLKTACRLLQNLDRHGLLTDFTIAVNISAHQFSDDHFLEKVRLILKGSRIKTRHLKFELTESCLVRDAERGRLIMTALRAMGLHIELDDFGTGYSSLTSLKNLPVDTLKLDSSLVHGIGRDTRDEAILCAAIAMAQALSLKIIAEGVETQQQNDFLIRKGCDMLQGYLHGRPMPYAAFLDQLRRQRDASESSRTAPHAAPVVSLNRIRAAAV